MIILNIIVEINNRDGQTGLKSKPVVESYVQ